MTRQRKSRAEREERREMFAAVMALVGWLAIIVGGAWIGGLIGEQLREYIPEAGTPLSILGVGALLYTLARIIGR